MILRILDAAVGAFCDGVEDLARASVKLWSETPRTIESEPDRRGRKMLADAARFKYILDNDLCQCPDAKGSEMSILEIKLGCLVVHLMEHIESQEPMDLLAARTPAWPEPKLGLHRVELEYRYLGLLESPQIFDISLWRTRLSKRLRFISSSHSIPSGP